MDPFDTKQSKALNVKYNSIVDGLLHVNIVRTFFHAVLCMLLDRLE